MSVYITTHNLNRRILYTICHCDVFQTKFLLSFFLLMLMKRIKMKMKHSIGYVWNEKKKIFDDDRNDIFIPAEPVTSILNYDFFYHIKSK